MTTIAAIETGRRQRLAEDELDVRRGHRQRWRDGLGRVLAQRLGRRCSSPRRRDCREMADRPRCRRRASDLVALSAAFARRPRRSCRAQRDRAGAGRSSRARAPASPIARCSRPRRAPPIPAYANINRSVDRAHARRVSPRRRGARSPPAIARSSSRRSTASSPRTPRRRRSTRGFAPGSIACSPCATRSARRRALHGRLPLALRRDARRDAHSRPRARDAVLGRVPDLRASVALSPRSRGSRASRTSTA